MLWHRLVGEVDGFPTGICGRDVNPVIMMFVNRKEHNKCVRTPLVIRWGDADTRAL